MYIHVRVRCGLDDCGVLSTSSPSTTHVTLTFTFENCGLVCGSFPRDRPPKEGGERSASSGFLGSS